MKKIAAWIDKLLDDERVIWGAIGFDIGGIVVAILLLHVPRWAWCITALVAAFIFYSCFFTNKEEKQVTTQNTGIMYEAYTEMYIEAAKRLYEVVSEIAVDMELAIKNYSCICLPMAYRYFTSSNGNAGFVYEVRCKSHNEPSTLRELRDYLNKGLQRFTEPGAYFPVVNSISETPNQSIKIFVSIMNEAGYSFMVSSQHKDGE